MTATPPTPVASPARGFALVGVVMFVLVLTILGLSLFSLSTIEGQFLNQSTSSAEAFYAASEGLERSRFVLTRTENLGAVATWVEGGTIVNAVAMQLQGSDVDSTGDVDWNGNPVTVRVLAIKRGQRSFLETQYRPLKDEDLYRRLMTVSNSVTVAHFNPDNGQPTAFRTQLIGEIWENVHDGSLTFPVPPTYTFSSNPGTVPDPDVATYLTQHLATATPLPHDAPGGVYTLDATGNPNNVKFFKTTGTLGFGGWSLNQPTQNYQIRVRGRVFWLFDHGARFDGPVEVVHEGVPSPDNALILVSLRGPVLPPGDDAFKGIALKSAMTTPLLPPLIPVILVSDGTVSVEHKVITNEASRIVPLSIFARDCYLLAPSAGLVNMTLTHPSVGPLSDLLDVLYDLGLLPNVAAGVSGTLPPIAGSWRDLTESNPS